MNTSAVVDEWVRQNPERGRHFIKSSLIAIDSLVRGHVGHTDRIAEVRVYRASPWGWVAGIDTEGRQTIIHDPEVVGPPRPEKERRDIPERLR